MQDFADISFLKLDKDKYDRISMIDMLWIDKNNIKYIIEVENATKFISGIQRASNADIAIPKLMVVPDNTEKKNF
ncbi:MAG: hypothetical protein LBR59_02620 [Endomicrobium sp.]|nr:hypothetical protein [Endomicrobium sp.]